MLIRFTLNLICFLFLIGLGVAFFAIVDAATS